MSPAFEPRAATVRVPASSANLGPGFDTLGLALGMHDMVTARVTDGGLTVDVTGHGAGGLRTDGRHLVVRAMRETFAVLGGQPPGLALRCANEVPHSRGLGSSSAAIVAGVCAARALVPGGLPDAEALRIATALEGHPDNVAACLYGGATAAWVDGSGVPHAEQLAVRPEIVPVAFVPEDARQSTRVARSLLPETVPFAVAARTAARTGLLVHALACEPDLLLAATDDELHQPPRLAGQPRTAEQVAVLRTAGVAAVLSGSGPSVLALCRTQEEAAAVTALALPEITAHPLTVDHDGATELASG